MNKKRLITVAFALLAVLALAGPAWAGLGVQETPLAPASPPSNGSAYEANLDSQGTLWVSDSGAGQIRSFEPTGAERTVYQMNGQPSDARSDGAGSVWWAEFDSNRLGLLSTSTNEATIWEIPDSYGLYSTAIDGNGNVWVSDYYASYIYRFDPDTKELCTYPLPDFGMSEYMYADGQTLWFGDYVKGRIVRLQDGVFDWWKLPGGSYPRDVEPDGSGHVWWTDANKGYLGRLDIGAAAITATITTFTPPAGGTPVMLALSGGKVWYSQQGPGQVVMLDPAVATPDAPPQEVEDTGSQPAVPDPEVCPVLHPAGDPAAITTDSAPAIWNDKTYTTTVNAGGWKMYGMPSTSVPWGIAARGNIWLVDQGRQVLARLGPSYTIEKQVSVDGGKTWVDADSMTGPELLKGNAPRFRVIASNTGIVDITVDVSDPNLPGLTANDVTLAVGAADMVVAGPVTGAWAKGPQTDTATVVGAYTDEGGHAWTDSQTDGANYFGADPGYTMEKQVSVDDGKTWVDADSMTGPELLKGNKPRFRVISSNAGNVDITLDVSDPNLAALDITGERLVVGATNAIVAGPVPSTWAEGQQINTATVGGAYRDDGSHTWSDSQHDSANYFGANPTEHRVYLPIVARP